MNARTARLLRGATSTKAAARALKRNWNRTPRDLREAVRHMIKNGVLA